MRYYAAWIARFISADPLQFKYPELTPFQYASNAPTSNIDLDGAEPENKVEPGIWTKPELPGSIVNGPGFNTQAINSSKLLGPGFYSASINARYIGFGVRNPLISLRIGFGVTPGATDISTNSTRFATRGEVLYGSKRIEDDRGSEKGAFRHCLWQATITSEYNKGIAAQAGNAHEEYPFTDLSIRSYINIYEADQTVDLLNNFIGRNIGEDNKNARMDELAILVLDEFKNKGLYTASKNIEGNWIVSKTKLSTEKYNQLKEIYKGLNENGRTPAEQITIDDKARKQLDELQLTWGTMK